MRFSQLFKSAVKSILRNRVRSFLTTLGIIIGVASVIVMVSIGKGAQNDIQNQIKSMGTNIIMIMPGSQNTRGSSMGAGSRQSLTLKDAELIQQVETVIAVSPVTRMSGQLVSGNGNWQTSMYGVTPEYLIIREWSVETGEMFTQKDVQGSSKVIVIGKTIAEELFPGQDPVGKSIRFGKVPLKIVGVLAAKGQNAMGQDQDDIVLAPVKTVLNRMNRVRHIQQIMASASTMNDITKASEEIECMLRNSHGITADDDNDFQIRTQSDIMTRATETARTMTLLLSAIAGVSLLVGGIGIMNIMLVSVTERTREIGIRMAIGARESDILMQFLIEAVVLSSMGGIIGVGISMGIVWAMTALFGLKTSVDLLTIGLALLFSAVVGIFFGFYPAGKAARLNPIEALRYE
ncbi:MAG: ABC transporter permease [Chitinispirillaceae bacterium]|nr:ABC transporter permease [Chitinispirillaceae bacterium]